VQVAHVDGAGHFVHVDQPAAVSEMIGDFLDQSGSHLLPTSEE
jgi:pimeloyl-ACP methyl ester carboxylesterase